MIKNPGRVLAISRGEHRRAKPVGARALMIKNPGRVLAISRGEHRRAKPVGARALRTLGGFFLGSDPDHKPPGEDRFTDPWR
jgi:hypothetical protein